MFKNLKLTMSISRGLEIHAELLPHLLLWVEHYVCNSILVSLHEDLQTVPYFYVICGEIFLLLFLYLISWLGAFWSSKRLNLAGILP